MQRLNPLNWNLGGSNSSPDGASEHASPPMSLPMSFVLETSATGSPAGALGGNRSTSPRGRGDFSSGDDDDDATPSGQPDSLSMTPPAMSGFASPMDHSFSANSPSAIAHGSELTPTLDTDEDDVRWFASPVFIEVTGYITVVAALIAYFLFVGTPAERACRQSNVSGAARVVQPAAPQVTCDASFDDAPGATEAAVAPASTTSAPECSSCGTVRPPHLLPFLDQPFVASGEMTRLGLRGPDEGYKSADGCMPTSELWPPLDAAFGSVPPPKSTCLERIEPLEGQLPLPASGNSVDTTRCARNARRFPKYAASANTRVRHVDPDEVHRRLSLTVMKFTLTAPCGPVAGAKRKLVVAGAGGDTSKVDAFTKFYPEPETFDMYIVDPRQTAGENRAAVGEVATAETSESPRDGKPRLKAVPRFLQAALWNESGFVTYSAQPSHRKGVPGIVGASDKSTGAAFHEAFRDPAVPHLFDGTDPSHLVTVAAIDAADYLAVVANKDDFVVLLLDVDGMEWQVAERLARAGAWALVDEVFVECHHGEWLPNWPTRHSAADCHRLLNTLRAHGVYAHEWFD